MHVIDATTNPVLNGTQSIILLDATINGRLNDALACKVLRNGRSCCSRQRTSPKHTSMVSSSKHLAVTLRHHGSNGKTIIQSICHNELNTVLDLLKTSGTMPL